jgi:hypothetical protein
VLSLLECLFEWRRLGEAAYGETASQGWADRRRRRNRSYATARSNIEVVSFEMSVAIEVPAAWVWDVELRGSRQPDNEATCSH